MMCYQVMKALLVGGALCGLCVTAAANTTADAGSTVVSSSGETAPVLRIGLLLPTRSPSLANAAAAVQQGFIAAHEQEKAAGNGDIGIAVFETGDSVQEVLAGYRMASMECDLVVGPLTRSGVAAVAKHARIGKPTLALAAPESIAGLESQVPRDMLAMGLSIEDEARQAADWASFDNSARMALVVSTRTAWQRRAATAFELQWRRLGYQSESMELAVASGSRLSSQGLNDLSKRIGSDQSVLVFAALDAVQARQLRQAIGSRILVYGTSQLNPVAVSDRAAAPLAQDMNGTRLLDIPWQLQADDSAVMMYPKRVLDADQRRNADLERLYALGIDAFRVAQEIAHGHRDFDMEGVTGKLSVHLDAVGASFERTVRQAIYRDGAAVAEAGR